MFTHVKVSNFVDHKSDFSIFGFIDFMHQLSVISLQGVGRERQTEDKFCIALGVILTDATEPNGEELTTWGLLAAFETASPLSE